MKVKLFYLKLILFISLTTKAESNELLGSQYHCVVGISSFHSFNKFNPASTPDSNHNIFLVNTSPNIMGVDELHFNEIYGKINVFNNIYTSLSYSGINNRLFTDNSIRIGFTYVANEMLQVGLEFNYNLYNVIGFTQQKFGGVSIGGKLKLDDKLYSAFILRNLFKIDLVHYNILEEQLSSFGLAYILSENLYIEVESIINISKSNALSLAVRYDIEKWLSARMAYLSNPQSILIGINLNLLEGSYLNYTVNKSNELGYSHSFGLSYLW
ncbi:MAG TPA: hypothetical protein PLE30_02365 [Candidatus Kapabacteria bacterium]|nr:hypothetical protein [Candidatus Kapabacteria bacterium]